MILLFSMSKMEHLNIYAIPLARVTPDGLYLILKLNIPQITLFERKCVYFKRKEECSQKNTKLLSINQLKYNWKYCTIATSPTV